MKVFRYPHCFLRVLPSFAAAAVSILFAAGEILASEIGQSRDSSPKILLIGIDGVPWSLLDPMMEAGELPNLHSLAKGGLRATMITRGDGSPSKWTTMATGTLSGRHGIHGFQVQDGTSMVPVRSLDRKVSAVWNWLSDAGRSVGVVNYRAGWPPEKVRGYVVTKREPGPTYPADLDLTADIRAIDELLPPLSCDKALRGSLQEAYEEESWALSTAAALAERYPTDLVITYSHSTDAVEHSFWKFFEPERFHSPVWNLQDEHVRCFKKAIPNVLKLTDSLIGDLLEGLNEQSTVIVVSDHGQIPMPVSRIHRIFVYDRFYAALGLRGPVAGEGQHDKAEPGDLISIAPDAFDRLEFARLMALTCFHGCDA